MPTLLQIHASLNGGKSLSASLGAEIVAAWQTANPTGEVLTRDLATDPVPHLDKERFAAFTSAPETRDPTARAAVEYSDALIGELRRADVIVLGLPMYNFGVPSTLKAYFDHIARAGQTFRYTPNGPEGLLNGKRAYVVATRGGMYAGTPADNQTDYVRQFLAFLGITDVEFIYAEGTALGDDTLLAAVEKARSHIGELKSRTAA